LSLLSSASPRKCTQLSSHRNSHTLAVAGPPSLSALAVPITFAVAPLPLRARQRHGLRDRYGHAGPTNDTGWASAMEVRPFCMTSQPRRRQGAAVMATLRHVRGGETTTSTRHCLACARNLPETATERRSYCGGACRSRAWRARRRGAYKRCSACRRSLPLEAYQRNRSATDGRQHACRPCQNAKQRQRDQRPEVKQRRRAYLIARRKEMSQ
jgi:hypothetical protein